MLVEDLRRRAAERAWKARTVLHPVASGTFRPHGRYDVRRVRRTPMRALRGGDKGLAASFRIVGGAVEITILATSADVSPDDAAWAMDAARAS